MTDTAPAPTLHQRKRAAAMQAAQRCAVELFSARGFDAVTVEEIAESAGVSPVSLYRWFGTKEGLVLWDEYDPGLFAAIAERLPSRPPLQAVRDALMAELEKMYDAEAGLVLARTQLVYREAALLAASARQSRELEAALATLFAEAGVGGDDFSRKVLAAACVGVLVAAISEWQEHDGQRRLAALISDGFDVLGRLS